MQTVLSTLERFWEVVEPLLQLFFSFHLIGFILGLLIIGRMINEKREPSNIFAWSLLILFLPVVGVPLYFLFGGRKSRRLVRRKTAISLLAREVMESSLTERENRAARTQAREGNRFQLLPSGPDTFRELCRQIDLAQQSISIMTYILGEDEPGRQVVQRLAARAREGVQVRLLLDALGSFPRRWSPTLRRLKVSNGQVSFFMPMLPLQTATSANLRNHRKIALFDWSRAVLGGQNLDARFMGPRPDHRMFHDFSALIEGPAVSTLNQVFVADWVFASEEPVEELREALGVVPPVCGESALDIISSGPDVDGDPLWEKVISMVQESRREITIVTPYFIPDEVLYRSLIVKSHSGRRVRLIVPARSNQALVDLARNHYLRGLHAAGVEVLLYHSGMIHAKLILVDGIEALIGSANIDPRSFFVNFEIGVVLSRQADVQALENWVAASLGDCHRFADDPRSRVGRTRSRAEDFAHLLVPLL